MTVDGVFIGTPGLDYLVAVEVLRLRGDWCSRRRVGFRSEELLARGSPAAAHESHDGQDVAGDVARMSKVLRRTGVPLIVGARSVGSPDRGMVARIYRSECQGCA